MSCFTVYFASQNAAHGEHLTKCLHSPSLPTSVPCPSLTAHSKPERRQERASGTMTHLSTVSKAKSAAPHGCNAIRFGGLSPHQDSPGTAQALLCSMLTPAQFHPCQLQWRIPTILQPRALHCLQQLYKGVNYESIGKVLTMKCYELRFYGNIISQSYLDVH